MPLSVIQPKFVYQSGRAENEGLSKGSPVPYLKGEGVREI